MRLINILNIFLIILATFLLVACSGQNNDSQTAVDNQMTGPTEPVIPAWQQTTEFTTSKALAEQYISDLDNSDKFDGDNFEFLDVVKGECDTCYTFTYSFDLKSKQESAKTILQFEDQKILRVDFKR